MSCYGYIWVKRQVMHFTILRIFSSLHLVWSMHGCLGQCFQCFQLDFLFLASHCSSLSRLNLRFSWSSYRNAWLTDMVTACPHIFEYFYLSIPNLWLTETGPLMKITRSLASSTQRGKIGDKLNSNKFVIIYKLSYNFSLASRIALQYNLKVT